MGTRPPTRKSRRPVRSGHPGPAEAGHPGPAKAGHYVPKLEVDIVTPSGVRAPGLARWLAAVAPTRARGAVTVALVPDRQVQALNRRFRGKNQATDVLSFPADEPGLLGDVVIALGVAARQAKAAGHGVPTELRVLALHGLLHLLGYDHEDDDGRMARVEARLRRKGGLREGLIERSR